GADRQRASDGCGTRREGRGLRGSSRRRARWAVRRAGAVAARRRRGAGRRSDSLGAGPRTDADGHRQPCGARILREVRILGRKRNADAVRAWTQDVTLAVLVFPVPALAFAQPFDGGSDAFLARRVLLGFGDP